MKNSRKIAVVTPDFVGPTRNGGVGTAVYWLSRQLTTAGYILEVIYTGCVETETAEYWEQHFYQCYGFRFVVLRRWVETEIPEMALLRFYPESENLRISYQVLEFLKQHDYTSIYFQDYLGHGFRTLQYKLAGLGFQKTPCVLTLHSSQRWIREGMAQLPQGFQDLELDFQERECARLADWILVPSRHMRDWAIDRWGVPRDRITVVPYCFDSAAGIRPRQRRHFCGFRHIVFFGRLETRKGLHFVLQALKQSPVLRERIRRVTFLGKHGSMSTGSSQVVIPQMLRGTPYRWQIIDDKDAHQVWCWLKQQKNILVVAPSTLDNLPFSIIELFAHQLPFVTTEAGGIPEIVGRKNRHLLAPVSANGVRECIEQVVGSDQLEVDFGTGFDAIRANRANIRFHRSVIYRHSLSLPHTPEKTAGSGIRPKISVIVPHFNSTSYLKLALRSLKNQTFKDPYEVIIVDDCSSDVNERESFKELALQYDNRAFKFISVPKNFGPGAARNRGSHHAKGKYLVFFDADNEAYPTMLEHMFKGIENSGCDSLSCFSKVIVQEDRLNPQPLNEKNTSLIYAPLGPCLETGFLHNIFGDTCSIIRQQIFQEMGGFSECPAHIEDWDLWARLTLSGRIHGIIPKILFRYRQQQSSRTGSDISRTASKHQILKTYSTHQDSGAVDWGSLCSAVVGTQGLLPWADGESSLGMTADEIYPFFANLPEAEMQRFLTPVKSDSTAQNSLTDIQTMRRRLELLMVRWQQLQPRIYVYGAGAHTKVLLGTLPKLVRWVSAFIDQRNLKQFLGRPCILPEQVDPTQVDVVIYSSKTSELQMHARLVKLPVEHVLIYNSIPNRK